MPQSRKILISSKCNNIFPVAMQIAISFPVPHKPTASRHCVSNGICIRSVYNLILFAGDSALWGVHNARNFNLLWPHCGHTTQRYRGSHRVPAQIAQFTKWLKVRQEFEWWTTAQGEPGSCSAPWTGVAHIGWANGGCGSGVATKVGINMSWEWLNR